MKQYRKKILIFGNSLVNKDSLPLVILPELKKKFPEIEFKEADPTEFLIYGDNEVWILDSAEGIDDLVVLDDLAKLDLPKRFSVHDYDLAVDLKLLEKIGKLGKVKIIAIPLDFSKKEALEKITKFLKSSEFSGNVLRN